jgi:hypothetical protein
MCPQITAYEDTITIKLQQGILAPIRGRSIAQSLPSDSQALLRHRNTTIKKEELIRATVVYMLVNVIQYHGADKCICFVCLYMYVLISDPTVLYYCCWYRTTSWSLRKRSTCSLRSLGP